MRKISVIIPVYNTSRYLDRCLKSVIEQDFRDIEIICVNDGSTDNSLEILNKFAQQDERIKIINKSNGGLTTARNAGLRIATGDYCLNIDSDDWIEQGYLKKIYEKAKKENLDMVISDIIFDYEYKNKSVIKKDLDIEDKKILTGEEYLYIFFTKNFMGYTWNKLIKKESYTKYKLIYDEDIFVYEDVEIISKLALHMKKIGKINQAYYHYIQGENNGSRKTKFKNYLDIEKCFYEVEQYYLKNKVNKKLIEVLQIRKIYRLFRSLFLSPYIKDDEYKNKLKKILQEVDILKNNLEIVQERGIILYLKLEDKLNKIENKVKAFELIKKIVYLRKMIRESYF